MFVFKLKKMIAQKNMQVFIRTKNAFLVAASNKRAPLLQWVVFPPRRGRISQMFRGPECLNF